MPYSNGSLRAELVRAADAIVAHGWAVRPVVLGDPVDDAAVEAAEGTLTTTFPPSLRTLLVRLAGELSFGWQLPREHAGFDGEFREIFSGELSWSIELIAEAEDTRRSWIANAYNQPTRPYDAVWHGKLGFMQVPNGDCIAIDLCTERYEQVVYLSHDGSHNHGHVMADDVLDLLDRWIPLGCPGPEDWQWAPFTSAPDPRIDPEGEVARRWRRFLGLPANLA